MKMSDIPLNAAEKVTVERRGQIILIGINRPYIHNRVDPEAFAGRKAEAKGRLPNYQRR
jgi:enoyl-CoA hydratase